MIRWKLIYLFPSSEVLVWAEEPKGQPLPAQRVEDGGGLVGCRRGCCASTGCGVGICAASQSVYKGGNRQPHMLG